MINDEIPYRLGTNQEAIELDLALEEDGQPIPKPAIRGKALIIAAQKVENWRLRPC